MKSFKEAFNLPFDSISHLFIADQIDVFFFIFIVDK